MSAVTQDQVPYVIYEAMRRSYAEDIADSAPIFAFVASADPDTMYLHQAMREPDRAQFIAAMEEEVGQHSANGNWTLMLRSQVPEGVPVIPAVWALKRKRRIGTREVYKWKA
jgi:hypothetical protein